MLNYRKGLDMTELPSEPKYDTILEATFGLCSESEPPNEDAFYRRKIGKNINKDNHPEIDVIEVPLFGKMLFQFNKPVKLEFS
jgi:hypothetical protein